MPFIFRYCSVFIFCAFLASCTAIKLTYNNADTLVYFWLDDYVDFTVDQKVDVKNDIQALHTWHRHTQLPIFVTISQNLQKQVQQNVTAEQLCTHWDQLRPTLLPPLSKYLEPSVSRLVTQLSQNQIISIEEKYAKTNKKWLEEWRPTTARELHKNSEKNIRERLENFYKKLSDDQLILLRQLIAALPFDAQIAYAERLRRQRDLVATLQNIRNKKLTPDAAKESLLTVLDRSFVSPDPAYRAYALRIKQSQCDLYAKLHNSMTPEQRANALQTLKDYERDFKLLHVQK